MVNPARLDAHLPVFRNHALCVSDDLDADYSVLNTEILGLVPVEVQRRGIGACRAIYQLLQIGWDEAGEVMGVGLSEEKAAPWRVLEEHGYWNAAEPG